MSAPLRLRPMAVALAPPKRHRAWWVAGALVAVALFVAVSTVYLFTPSLPRAPLRTDAPLRGAYHLHSELSHDSRVSLDAYARAARTRGLDFLVFTEHDVQGPPPEMREGVLLLHQSELNFAFGHVVSLGATRALDWAERADPQGLERIAMVGGHGIVAHPTSKRRPWTGPLSRMRGIEVQNAGASFEHYAEPLWLPVLPFALAYWLRPELALAQLYERDPRAHATWDALPPSTVGLAGIDAHGWLSSPWDLTPWHMVLTLLSRPEEMTPALALPILDALTTGKAYASAGLWQQPLDLQFERTMKNKRVSLRACAGTEALREWSLVLLRDGREVTSGPLPCVEWPDPEAGVYRAELRARMPTLSLGTYPALLAWSPRIVVESAP